MPVLRSLLLLLLCLPLVTQAAPREHLIPGGLGVIELPAGFTGEARFNRQPLFILAADEQQPARALVGIPLQQKPGSLQVDLGGTMHQIGRASRRERAWI